MSRRRPAKRGARAEDHATPIVRSAFTFSSRRRWASHLGAIAQLARASGCRPEGCEWRCASTHRLMLARLRPEPRWSRARGRLREWLKRAGRNPAARKGRGGSNPSPPMHTVVAQWIRAPGYGPGGRAFESRRRYRTQFAVTRGWCKRLGTRGCGPLRAGSRPVPLTRLVEGVVAQLVELEKLPRRQLARDDRAEGLRVI